MEYEKCVCPVLNVNGVMATGKQYDLDITLPDGNVKKYHKRQTFLVAYLLFLLTIKSKSYS